MIVDGHSFNMYHLYSMSDANAVIKSMESPQHNVNVCIKSALAKIIEENRVIIHSCAECILFCVNNFLIMVDEITFFFIKK